MFFKSKPKFTFYSSIPGVAETYPIIEAKTYRPDWAKTAAQEFKKKVSNLDNYQGHLTGVAKCPGIFDLMHQGWILTSWFDFIIETNQNGINWRAPALLDAVTCGEDFNKPVITFIDTQNPEMFVPIKESDIPLLVKIHTPWCVDIPKGWKLLVLPVSYSDDTRFSSTAGIITQQDHMEINPQLFWSVRKGTELVKAGTPLCQLIPVPDTYPTFEIKPFGEEQRLKQKQTYFKRASTFVRKA